MNEIMLRYISQALDEYLLQFAEGLREGMKEEALANSAERCPKHLVIRALELAVRDVG